jgi:phage shock protein A
VQSDPREALRHAIAYEHRLFTELQRHEQQAALWQQRADLASRHGDDALALEALARKAASERRAQEYRAQYMAQGQAVRRAKQGLRPLPAAPSPPTPSAEQRLERLAVEDRLERDLAALKAELQTR